MFKDKDFHDFEPFLITHDGSLSHSTLDLVFSRLNLRVRGRRRRLIQAKLELLTDLLSGVGFERIVVKGSKKVLKKYVIFS